MKFVFAACLCLFLLDANGISVRAQTASDAASDNPMPQGQGMAAPSGSQASLQSAIISSEVSRLMNEKYLPSPAGQPAPTPTSAMLQPFASRGGTATSSQAIQAEDQAAISDRVSKLYGEKLPSLTPPVIHATTIPVSNPVPPVPAAPPVAAPVSVGATPVVPLIPSVPPASAAPMVAAAPAPVPPAPLPPPPTPALANAVAATAVVPPAAAAISESALSAPAPTVAGIASVPPVSSGASSDIVAPTASVMALNHVAPATPDAPKLASPTSSFSAAIAPEPASWNVPVPTAEPNTQPGPGVAKAAAAEARAAASAGATAAESAGNASDLGDAAYIKNLAGSDGLLNLDLSGPVSPSEADRSVPVDRAVHIDEAVAFALKNNYEVQAAEERVNGAYWDKMGAYAQYGPSAEYDWDEGAERSEPAAVNDANGNRILDNTHHRRDNNFSVRQPLIDLSVIAQILSSDAKEEAIKSDQRDVREKTALDTINVFLKLVQARIAVRLADQYKAYLDDLANRMTARVQGGGGTNADLDRVHARSELAAAAHIEAMGEYETDLTEFCRLTKVRPPQIKIPDLLAPPVPDNIEEALDSAVHANPAYLSSLSKMDAAEEDRNKNYAGLIPKLSVQYNRSFSYDAGGSAEGNPVDGVYPDQKEESVLLVAQWVLGGSSITSGLSGQAKTREMRLESQDILDRMDQAMRSSYTAINAARQRRHVLQKTVAENQRVVEGFEEQYKEGTRSLFELLDSYEQLYNSKVNLMRVVIANAQAAYQVRREMGELVPSIMGAEPHMPAQKHAQAETHIAAETH